MYLSKVLCTYKREDIHFISRNKSVTEDKSSGDHKCKDLVPFSCSRCEMCPLFSIG